MMYQIEISLLIIIIIIQGIAVADLLNRISVLKSIFDVSPSLDGANKQFSYEGGNQVKETIVSTINNYIDRNRGGVIDFHIINDIVERNIATLDEEISNKIPTPLYLGLAGTMIGIIVGLFFLDFSEKAEVGNIAPLIEGVRYAMSVSVIGLVLTTVLSVWFYKNAKSEVNSGKNDFLSQIQTELLPTLIKSDDVAIQELSQELRMFSKSTPRYVKSLQQNTGIVKETIEKEISLLEQIKALDVRQLSQSNIEIFNSLSGMMDSFKAFPAYYEELNRSLHGTTELNSNLQQLLSSSRNVNEILSEVRNIIETSNSASSFFNEHIRSFERYSEAVSLSVAETNTTFEKALGKLEKAVVTQLEAFNVAIAEYDSKLSKSFDTAIEKYIQAFSNATPEFQNLKHLEKLDLLLQSDQSLKDIKKTLEIQSGILKNLDVQLPENLNVQMKNNKTIFDYIKDGVIVVAGIAVIVMAVYMIIKY